MPAHARARGARKVCVGTAYSRSVKKRARKRLFAFVFCLCWILSDRALAVALCMGRVLDLVAQQGILR